MLWAINASFPYPFSEEWNSQCTSLYESVFPEFYSPSPTYILHIKKGLSLDRVGLFSKIQGPFPSPESGAAENGGCDLLPNRTNLRFVRDGGVDWRRGGRRAPGPPCLAAPTPPRDAGGGGVGFSGRPGRRGEEAGRRGAGGRASSSWLSRGPSWSDGFRSNRLRRRSRGLRGRVSVNLCGVFAAA